MFLGAPTSIAPITMPADFWIKTPIRLWILASFPFQYEVQSPFAKHFKVQSIYTEATRSQLRDMKQQFKTYLARQIRSERRRHGLTQEELGARIGRTAEAISNIERGKSLPSLETLVALSEALELSLRSLIPEGGFDSTVSQNRLTLEAEALSVLRGLSDSQMHVALAQLKALSNLAG
jgi:transcriptional regulator with XRE-family HTH domain